MCHDIPQVNAGTHTFTPAILATTNGPPELGSGTQFTQEELIQYFMSHGYGRPGAIAIVANLQSESGLSTAGPTGSQGEEGLAQWKGKRLVSLQSDADSHGLNWRSKDAQAGFLLRELEQVYPSLAASLKTATDPARAAEFFCAQYEVPTLDDGTPNYATYAVRRRTAEQIAGG